MAILFTNNAESSLVSAIASTDTTITLQAGEGARFPNPVAPDIAYVSLWRGVGSEVVKLTSRTGDTLTVVRGQDGTQATAWGAATPVGLRLPATVANTFVQRPELAAYAALAGSVNQTFSVANATASGHAVNMGQADGRYLGISAQAADSAKLGGTVAASYALIANTLPLQPDLGNAIDLNTITATGMYYQQSNAQAAAGTNYPTPYAGILLVYREGLMLFQVYQHYTSGLIYSRSYYNGTWYAWNTSATQSWVTGQNYITSAGAPVQSVAGRTGAVTLANTDISGLGTASTHPATDFLGATAQAVDSAKLGGTVAASYALQTWVNGAFASLSADNALTGKQFIHAHTQYGAAPAISLAIGDNDTGFNWNSDGSISPYANNTSLGTWTTGAINFTAPIQQSGNQVWHAGNFAPSSFLGSQGQIADTAEDTATANGFYLVNHTGDSSGLLAFNVAGSLGPLQMYFTYQGGFSFRNKTDSTTWTAWRNIWHDGNLTNLNQLTNGPGFIAASGAPVQSVAGRTGAVTLSNTDISGLGTSSTHASTDFLGATAQAADSAKLNGQLPSYYASAASVPTNLNQLTNGPGYITSSGAPVQSVAGKTGAVTLAVADITDISSNYLGINATAANATTWAGSHQTQSTAAPSGGASGDVWFQYT